MDSTSMQDRLISVVRKDPRYAAEAYHFVFEALDYTVRKLYGGDDADEGPRPGQHVTGCDLLDGLRDYAIETFGCMAAIVFEAWGVRRGEDFGDIVFNLVEHELMGSQESDSRADFVGGYGGRPFEEVFDVRPRLEYCSDRDEWKATYESVAFG